MKQKIKYILVVLFLTLSLVSFGQTSDAAKSIQTKIDIGGYALYVNMAGAGSPTVIFEAGSPGTSSNWNLVQPEISKITKTFSYDRAGLGKSDKRNIPNTCQNQVHELHALLKKADAKEPYIFVANSYGAYLAKLFTATYPQEVAGIVFVDGTHEKYSEYLQNNLSPEQLDNFKKMTISNPDGNFEEFLISYQQVKEAEKQDALRKKPVIVLTSDHQIMTRQYANTPMIGAIAQWLNWQRDLVALSDNSKQYVIKGSGHVIQRDKPQIVINAIKKMINYDLQNRPLPAYKMAAIAPEKLKRFAGKYLFAVNDILTIKEENGHLYADIPYLMQTEMCPISESEIITKDMDVAATIIKLTGSGIVIKNNYSLEEKRAKRVDDHYLTPDECLASGKIEKAINKYKKIKKSDPGNAAITESRLNTLGYNLLSADKIKEALAVFKLNVDFYPQSANTYDSYAEALLKNGNQAEAMENYKQSVALNPDNQNAINVLAKLKAENKKSK